MEAQEPQVIWVMMWTRMVIRLNRYEKIYGEVVKKRIPIFPSAVLPLTPRGTP